MKTTIRKASAVIIAAALVISMGACGLTPSFYKLERDKNGIYQMELQKGEIRFYEDDKLKVALSDVCETLVSDEERDFAFTFTVTPKDGLLASCSDFSYELRMNEDYAKPQDCLSYSADTLSEYSQDEQSFRFEVKGIELAKGTKDLSWLEGLDISFSLGTRKVGAFTLKDGVMVADYEDTDLGHYDVSMGIRPEGAFKGIEGTYIAEDYIRTETLDESLGFTHTGITGFFTDLFNMLRKRNPGSN